MSKLQSGAAGLRLLFNSIRTVHVNPPSEISEGGFFLLFR